MVAVTQRKWKQTNGA